MAGRTGYTATPAAFDPQVHMDAIFAHFDPLIGESRANAASFPASGNWLGRVIMAEDTGGLYLCTALPGTWKALTEPFASVQASTATAGTVTSIGTMGELTSTSLSQVVTPTRACRARITIRFVGSTSVVGSQYVIGAGVTGATTIVPAATDIGRAQVDGPQGISYESVQIVNLNAGANTVTVLGQAIGAGGTRAIRDIRLIIEPVMG